MEKGRGKGGLFAKGNKFSQMVPMEPPADAAEVVLKLASKGISEINIARALGVTYKTWALWRKAYPDIEEARKIGRGIEHDQLFDTLFSKAKGGNITACIFLLKTRHGYIENAPFEVHNKVSIDFTVPGALNEEQYEEIILKNTLPKKELKKLKKVGGLIRG